MLFYLLLGNRQQQFEKLSFAFKPWGQDGQKVSQKLLIWENTVHCSSMPLLPMGDELNPSHTVRRGRGKAAMVSLGCKYRFDAARYLLW